MLEAHRKESVKLIISGHFGCVYKGYLQTPGEKGEQIVAAKTLHRKCMKCHGTKLIEALVIIWTNMGTIVWWFRFKRYL